MRIALLYPPPWKIPMPGEAADAHGDGPPAEYREGDLDPDFHQTPYGLFTIGAQAMRAGHQVKVINLSGFAWKRVEEVVAALDADVFGMSCWTANRRGVALTADLVRRLHPRAHIVVGGPHATPLAKEMLAHYLAIDTVCTGESEETFMEIVDSVERGQSTVGIPGTVYRGPEGIVTAPERPAIADLDTLASPHDYFATHIVMTSRGCPWACTFCGAEASWGRGFRGQSTSYVLDALEAALERLPVRMIQIKDDTFTTNRKRVVELCQGIRARKLNFLWSCDTRVDVLSEPLLHEMRLAGCQRLSLGVESGSPKILASIDKKITVDKIIASAELAKKYGIQVRFYMMLGNRGETAETFRETLAFLERAKPHQYLFSCLSIYPGTRDFEDAEKAGWLSRDVYFEGDFQELKTPYDATPEDAALMSEWFSHNSGVKEAYREGVVEYQAILERLGDHHAAHLDLGAAYLREGDLGNGEFSSRNLDAAERHVRRAMELDHPLPGLCLNHLACIAFARGDVQSMQDNFSDAARRDPQHWVLIQNVQAARAWFARGGPDKGLPLSLAAQHDFALLERNTQPALPGPLPDDFAEWTAPPAPRQRARAVGAEAEPTGDGRTRLKLVST